MSPDYVLSIEFQGSITPLQTFSKPCIPRSRPPGNRVRLSVWGSVDTLRDTMDMKVGLPAETLALAGIPQLSPDYVLPLEIQGSITSPHLDWTSAARKVAVLSAMQLGRSLGIGGGANGNRGAAVGGVADGSSVAAAAAAGAGGPGGTAAWGGGGGGAPFASVGSAMRRASQVFLQQCIMVGGWYTKPEAFYKEGG